MPERNMYNEDFNLRTTGMSQDYCNYLSKINNA